MPLTLTEMHKHASKTSAGKKQVLNTEHVQCTTTTHQKLLITYRTQLELSYLHTEYDHAETSNRITISLYARSNLQNLQYIPSVP